METYEELKNALIRETEKFQYRHDMSETVGPDFYEPGMMEYPEQYSGSFDADSGIFTMTFEVMGTRYEGRTELIEKVNPGEEISVVRDSDNKYNSDNFVFVTEANKNLGNMPAELCRVMAPLYDNGKIEILSSFISFVDPISKRSRYAKKSVLFVSIKAKLM